MGFIFSYDVGGDHRGTNTNADDVTDWPAVVLTTTAETFLTDGGGG